LNCSDAVRLLSATPTPKTVLDFPLPLCLCNGTRPTIQTFNRSIKAVVLVDLLPVVFAALRLLSGAFPASAADVQQRSKSLVTADALALEGEGLDIRGGDTEVS